MACGHNFIGHLPSNAIAEAENKEMQWEYLEMMAKIMALRANKKGRNCESVDKSLTTGVDKEAY